MELAITSVENANLKEFLLINNRFLIEKFAFENMRAAKLSQDVILIACLEEHYRRLIVSETSALKRELLYKEAYTESTKIHDSRGQLDHGINESIISLVWPYVVGRHVLEIGCGTGLFAEKISGAVKSYTGIDASEGAIEKARIRNKNKSNVEFICDSVASPKLESTKHYDVAYSNDVLEHLHPDDLKSVLSFCKKYLVSGGVFFASTSNKYFGPFDVSRLYVPLGGKSRCLHINEMSYGELGDTLSSFGFHKIKSPVLPLSIFLKLRNIFGLGEVLMCSTKIKESAEKFPKLRKILKKPLCLSGVIIRAESEP